MKPARKLHPADVATLEAIQQADHFDVSVFVGTGHYDKRTEIADFATALAIGRELEAASTSGRKMMIYAITPDGQSVLVPPSAYQSTLGTSTAPMEGANDMTALETLQQRKSPLAALASAAKNETAVTLTTCKIDHSADGAIPKAMCATCTPRPKATAKATAKAIAPTPSKTEKTAPEPLKSVAIADTKTSTSKPPKEAKVKRTRDTSPDALKPVVPKHGAALELWNDNLKKATKGQLPPVPDFSAETHARFRDRLKAIHAFAKAGDLDALKADKTQPLWSSQTQIVRYRQMCIYAIEVQKGQRKPETLTQVDPKSKKTPASSERRKAEPRKATAAKKKTAKSAARKRA